MATVSPGFQHLEATSNSKSDPRRGFLAREETELIRSWKMETGHSRRHCLSILGFLIRVSRPPTKRSLAVGDFNGDGSQDLVATNVAGSVSVLLGNGDGSFPAPLIFNAGRLVYSLAVGDFNNDHVQNLATTNDGPVQLGGGFSILLGNGNGSFGMPLHFELAGGFMGSIAMGDFNSDGNHDLILRDSRF